MKTTYSRVEQASCLPRAGRRDAPATLVRPTGETPAPLLQPTGETPAPLLRPAGGTPAPLFQPAGNDFGARFVGSQPCGCGPRAPLQQKQNNRKKESNV
jgi:hypothetical protein